MDCLYKTFDPRYVQFEIDTYWIQAGGCNPEEWIYKVDKRMDVVHFKDYQMKGNEPRFCEIGEGNLNWNNIIKACKETAVKYVFVEQDSFTDDPIASLRLSYEFLAE
jgi:sugar phosphate isomerase/epimerase